MTNFIDTAVRAINALNSNVWGFSCLCLGVFLFLHSPSVGGSIITGSFAILRSNNETPDGKEAS
jgi:hypothetical protein